jgi:peroxiredoxin|tara:strand:- start:1098 stop:1619 length:522 start_codon:yes stop_codon:yes gene_type:complete
MMANLKAGTRMPDFRFQNRVAGAFTSEVLREKANKGRIVLFGLPGAFTPTCSTQQLPKFEELYDELIEAGVDDVFCTSVNDPFVMNSWFDSLDIKKVKSIPDGNADLAQNLGMFVTKRNLNFGGRSWRYALVVDTEKRIIEKTFIEEGLSDEMESDPYEASTPENVLAWLKAN